MLSKNNKQAINTSNGKMVGEYRRLVAITAVVLAMVALASVTYHVLYNPEAVLRREMEHLRDQGVPVERVYRDDDFGCLVVEFMDMEDEYVQPVREVVGYGQPVLFRELETPEALVGEPPSTPLEVCRAYNALEEGLDHRVIKEPDFVGGLLRLKFMDELTENEVEAVTGLVGEGVAIEFHEWGWKDRILVGEPTFETERLEAALSRLEGLPESIRDAMWGNPSVDERMGMLRIDLYRLRRYSGVIDAVRDAVGGDTPVVFFLYQHEPYEAETFTSPVEVVEDYVGLLNFTDVGYEILSWTEETIWSCEKAVASIHFVVDGEHVQFEELRLEMRNGTWESRGRGRWGTRSPSSDVEIVGYLFDAGVSGKRRLNSVTPVVENTGEGTAYVTEVEVEVGNSTWVMRQSYSTFGGGFWDGLIKAKSVDYVGPVYPEDTWVTEDGSLVTLRLSPMRGKTYTITITLRDGEGTVLASETFTHVFQDYVNPGP